RTGPTDRVQLVDEYDRRRSLLRLCEEIAHARGPDADNRLHEFRGGHREERHIRLTGNSPRQEGLPGARWAGEEHAMRNPPAELQVLVRATQEVDHFGQLRLRLVDSGHVGEGHAIARGLVAARP